MMTLRRPPRRGFSGNPFTPAELFYGGVDGVWFDPSDLGTMFQDAPGTTPVTAADQPVGLILDKSGNGNHASQTTSAKRPMLRTDGRLWWLEFDGVDDFFTLGNVLNPVKRNYCFSVGCSIVGDNGTVFAKSLYYNDQSRFSLLRETQHLYGLLQNPDLSETDPNVSGDTTSAIRVLSMIGQPYSYGRNTISINGGQLSVVSLFTPQTLSMTTVYRFLIGAYNNATDSGEILYLSGKIFGFLGVLTASPSLLLLEIEKYLAAKSGVVF